MKVAKKLYFDIQGIGRINGKDGEFDPGGEKRDPVIADTGVVGYSEETVAPTVSFNVPNTANVSLNDLRNLVGVSVTVIDDNGGAWVISGCWMNEPPKLSGGEYSCAMTGISADPIE